MNIFWAITSWLQWYDAFSKTKVWSDVIWKAKEIASPIAQAFTPAIQTAKSSFSPISNTVSSIWNTVVKDIAGQNKREAYYKPFKSEIEKIGLTYDDLAELQEEEKQQVISQLQSIWVEIPGINEQVPVQEDLWVLWSLKEWAIGASRVGQYLPEIAGNIGGMVPWLLGEGAGLIGGAFWVEKQDNPVYQILKSGQRTTENIGRSIVAPGEVWLTEWQKSARRSGATTALTLPVGGWYLKWAKWVWNLAGRSGLVGAWIWSTAPVIQKGSDASVEDVVSGWVIWGWSGLAVPLLWGLVGKWLSAWKNYITKLLPENLQVSGQFNRADLTNVSERIAKLTGKEIEVNDASRWLLNREIKWDLGTQRKLVQESVKNSSKQADQILWSKIWDVWSSKEANNLRKALFEKAQSLWDNIDWKFVPSAGNEEKYNTIRKIIDNPKMTLREMNEWRTILWEDIFNKQGTMKELASKSGWQNVWKDTSQFIEKKAPGFRNVNKDIEVWIAIDKAMLKKETAEQTKQMLAYLWFWGGTGGAIGYSTSGGDIWSTIKGIGIGFWVWQASRILNSPWVKSNLAYYLNKLTPSARATIQKIKKGIEIKPEDIGAVVEEMKLLPPPSGKPLSAKEVNVKPIIMGSKSTNADTWQVGMRPWTSKIQQKIEESQKLLPSPKLPKWTSTPRNDIVAESMRNTNSKGPEYDSKQSLSKPISSDTIPDGYFKNAFWEIQKLPSNKNGGFLRIGSESKKLTDPLVEEARKYKSWRNMYDVMPYDMREKFDRIWVYSLKHFEDFYKKNITNTKWEITMYRWQSKPWKQVQFNDTKFQWNTDGWVFFTPNKDIAKKYWENIIELKSNKNNTLLYKEAEKLQKMAEKMVSSNIKNGITSKSIIEQMALWRPKAFAEYTKKPFLETWDMFWEQWEMIYYKNFDNK